MAEQKKAPHQEEKKETLVRIASQDILGEQKIYPGLTKIKGVSWAISNALCVKLHLDRNMKLSELSPDQLKKIEDTLKNLDLQNFLKNRQNDFDSGENKHLLGVDLDLAKEFDIKRLKKIKSYKGMRHSLGQPVRGQRTRSHFRKTGIAVGVKKKKA